MPTKRASVGRLFVGFFVILFFAPGFPLQPRLRKSLPKMCVKNVPSLKVHLLGNVLAQGIATKSCAKQKRLKPIAARRPTEAATQFG